MTPSTADGLRLFGKIVRWMSTILALYVAWVAWGKSDFVLALIVAAVIFITGNGFGWWVQLVAERNR